MHPLLTRFFLDAPDSVQRMFVWWLGGRAVLLLRMSLLHSRDWAHTRKDRAGVNRISKAILEADEVSSLSAHEFLSKARAFTGSLSATLTGHVLESSENLIDSVAQTLSTVQEVVSGNLPARREAEALSEALVLMAEGESEDVDEGREEEEAQIEWIRRNWDGAGAVLNTDTLTAIDAYIANGLLIEDE